MHEAPSPAPYRTNCGVALFCLAVLPRTCSPRHLYRLHSSTLTDIHPVSRATGHHSGDLQGRSRAWQARAGFAGFASIVDLVDGVDDRNKDIPLG